MNIENSRKKNPGDYLQWRLLDQVVGTALLAMMGLSWIGAIVFTWFVEAQSTLSSTWKVAFIVLPGVIILAWACLRILGMEQGDWRISNMRKGLRAEARIGHTIEWALSSYACAVAHNVMDHSPGGDIDHLVATPKGLWVIETKYGRVNDKRFPNTLRSIARNVHDVREQIPNANVTGCLVFATDPGKVSPSYDYDGEQILCFPDPNSLAHALRKEARSTASSNELAKLVWDLRR